ncbi:ABC transporter substrate-binding protein [Chromobacterium sp. IIBBL 290-4]|uniref:substrate-binding periplasmic protein n=1 Tax=Chromobacterium sp. IIBBL 290-4 TaxID=2953890 RepID=UPI0020B6F5CF|nr:transporter substrate-binding domain-containing protein [Chromobacterium sp. IIBBL 290-4]UTH76413.1 transporter substrate-binding domain-containing protein [Chromobacterium sp. IIBBL 290-4]
MKLLPPLLLACWAAAAPAAALIVGIGDQAFPPYKLGNQTLDPSRPGLSVELTRLAVQSCGLKAEFRLLPGARLLKELEIGNLDAVMMLSYTPERARFAVYPLRNGLPDEARRLATLSYVLYALKGSPLAWDGHHLSNQKRAIGTNAGWSINLDLQRMGIPAEAANSVEQNFDKLLSRHIDGYAVHESLGDAYLASHPALPARKLSPPISTKPYFLPFSRHYAAAQPSQMECVWHAVSVKRDELLRRRISAYLDGKG